MNGKYILIYYHYGIKSTMNEKYDKQLQKEKEKEKEPKRKRIYINK